MFRTVPLSIIRSFSLYTQLAVSKPVWHIPMLCVYSENPLMMDRGTVRNMQFYSKNRFEKLVHLVGFIIRIYHDARSPERQNRPTALYSDYHMGYDAVLHVAAVRHFQRNLACALNAEDGGETITGNSGIRLGLPGHSLNVHRSVTSSKHRRCPLLSSLVPCA